MTTPGTHDRPSALSRGPIDGEVTARVLVELLGDGAAGHLARCFLAGEQANARLNGYSASPRLSWLTPVMRRLVHLQRGYLTPVPAEVADGTTEPEDEADAAASSVTDWITSEEAAVLLACTPRNVRALASRGVLHARRQGHLWLIDRTDVLDRAAARRSRAGHA